MYKHAVVVGKFAPLHKGHIALIEYARSIAKEVTVVTYSNPDFAFRSDLEYQLKDLDVKVNVVSLSLIDYPDMPLNTACDLDQQRFFAKVLKDKQIKPDVMVSSEEYGEPCVEYLNSVGFSMNHELFDIERSEVPISATQIREDAGLVNEYMLFEHTMNLPSRICIIGAESTGKSTLVEALADKYQEFHVPEYGREYFEKIRDKPKPKDFDRIAKMQLKIENTTWNKAVDAGHDFVFCDTNPWVTWHYSKHYTGLTSDYLTNLLKRHYSAFIYCHPTTPYVQDGTRESEDFRLRQNEIYLKHLHLLPDVPILHLYETSQEKRLELVDDFLSSSI